MAGTAAMRKRKQIMFGSLLMCCLSASLLAAAFGTEYWFVSDSKWTDEVRGSGNIHFGLFKGFNRIDGLSHRTHTLYVVCQDDKCMYSCADTEEHRQEQLQMLLNGETDGLKENCEASGESFERRPVIGMDLSPSLLRRDVDDMRKNHLESLLSSAMSPLAVIPDRPEDEHVEDANHVVDSAKEETTISGSTDATITTDGSSPEELEFMDYGLWVGTIACLSGGLLMAVVGALFAIVNTATTPVEAITGVPGLYVWNGLAALFDMVTAILWAVQFHMHLTSNVLLYDANDGWSTEGMEVFGYSFWLVVVAIFVHVANIVIIAIGTWEPKKKDQLQAPESKGGNIMLY